MGFVEYEPEKRTVHGPDLNQSIAQKLRGTILLASAVVPLDQLPEGQPDMVQIDSPNAGIQQK